MYCQQCQRILATPDRLCETCSEKLIAQQKETPENADNDLWLNLELVTLGYITYIRIPTVAFIVFLLTMSAVLSAILVIVMVRAGIFG